MPQVEVQGLDLLTVEQLARELTVKPKTVLRWHQKKTGPKAIKVGTRLIFRRADVLAWLDAQADAQAANS
jgi:excisionase family DNA binding protein